MEKATEAREKNNVGALVDETNLALVNIEMENNLADLTVSEKIDKLKENGILNDDMTFVSNSDYSLSYNGNIIDNKNKAINNLTLTNDKIYCEMNSQFESYDGSCTLTIIDGEVTKDDSKKNFIFKANEPPNGYKFAYWVDKNNNIVSYSNEVHITLYNDNIFTPIYVKNNIDVNKKNIIYTDCFRYYMNDNSGKQRVAINVFSNDIDGDSDITIGTGILRTYNEYDINNLKINNSNATNSSSSISESNPCNGWYNIRFNINIGASSTNKSKNIYYKAYGIFKNNTTGETETIYSNLMTLYPPDTQ